MNEVVIVGSGSCLGGSGLGAKIDSCDNVVRFKDQLRYIKEYSNDIGSKSSSIISNGNAQSIIIFMNMLDGAYGKIWKEQNLKEVFFTVSITGVGTKQYGGTPKGVIEKTKSGKRLLNHLEKAGTPLKFIDRDDTLETLKTFGFVGVAKPTSGLMIICHLLKEYDKINLCGFDFLAGQKSLHHFYDNGGIGGAHDLKAEAKIIRSISEQTQKISIWR